MQLYGLLAFVTPVIYWFPSPDGEEVSATRKKDFPFIGANLFPSPDGEEVSATKEALSLLREYLEDLEGFRPLTGKR